MNKQDIIRIIDPEVYYKECDDARKAAPYTGDGNASITYRSSIPIEINDLIWYNDSQPMTDKEKVRLVFDIYQDMPCYALLIELTMHYDNQLVDDAKKEFWQHIYSLLSQYDDALAEPVSYMLWCDFFEFPDRCEEAWSNLMVFTKNDNLIRRLLKISGPIPFVLKYPLYEELIKDKKWHNDIFYSLSRSYFDAYGKVDKNKAANILERLSFLNDTEELVKLRKMLNS